MLIDAAMAKPPINGSPHKLDFIAFPLTRNDEEVHEPALSNTSKELRHVGKLFNMADPSKKFVDSLVL